MFETTSILMQCPCWETEEKKSRNCRTEKVIKVESSKMQERHDQAWKNWRTARKSRSVVLNEMLDWNSCLIRPTAEFSLSLSLSLDLSRNTLPRLKLYKIHIHDKSFLCDFTCFLLEIQSRICFSSWLRPNFQRIKQIHETNPEQSVFTNSKHTWTTFEAQNTTWCSKSVLAPPEPSCSNEGQQEKEKRWPGVRSPGAAGSYAVFLSSILLILFNYCLCILHFSCSHEHVQIPHTHTHVFLLQGVVCICYAGLFKGSSIFWNWLKLSVIDHTVEIWPPNNKIEDAS